MLVQYRELFLLAPFHSLIQKWKNIKDSSGELPPGATAKFFKNFSDHVDRISFFAARVWEPTAFVLFIPDINQDGIDTVLIFLFILIGENSLNTI